MADVSQQEIQDVQKKTVQIGERLKSDDAFREQYKSDPEGTLKAEGLPDEAARELLSKAAKAAGADDVQGYDFYIDTYYSDGVRRDWYTDWGTWYGYQIFWF